MLRTGIQKAMYAIAKHGCFFLCMVRSAEMRYGKDLNEFDEYYDALEAEEMNKDTFMFKPEVVMNRLSKGKDTWTFQKELPDFDTSSADIVCARYVNGVRQHFALVDPKTHEVIYDPLGDNDVVNFGKIHSFWIFNKEK